MRVLYCILGNRFGGPHRLALRMARRLRFSLVSNQIYRQMFFGFVLFRYSLQESPTAGDPVAQFEEYRWPSQSTPTADI